MIPNNVFQILCKINPAMQSFQNVKSPDDMAQQLLNSGRVTQEQVNRAKQMWEQPNVQQMIQNKFRLM